MIRFGPDQMLAFQEHAWRLVIERLVEMLAREFPFAHDSLGTEELTRFALENAALDLCWSHG